MAERQNPLPQRAVWPIKRVGVRKRLPKVNNAVSEDTFGDAIDVGGAVDDVDHGDYIAAGFTTELVDISVEMLATPFTRSIERDWRLEIDNESYLVERIDRSGQFNLRIYAHRYVGNAV